MNCVINLNKEKGREKKVKKNPEKKVRKEKLRDEERGIYGIGCGRKRNMYPLPEKPFFFLNGARMKTKEGFPSELSC